MTRQESDKRSKKMIDDKFHKCCISNSGVVGLQPGAFIAAIFGEKLRAGGSEFKTGC